MSYQSKCAGNPNLPYISTPNGGITLGHSPLPSVIWHIVTSADNVVTLVDQNGYIPKGAGQVIFTLPPAAAVGDTYQIVGYGNLWTVQQNSNQTIYLGIEASTTGVGGSISATFIMDCVQIVCVTANQEFIIFDCQGNIAFV